MVNNKREYKGFIVILTILFAVVILKYTYNFHKFDILIDSILVLILIYAGYIFYKNRDEIKSRNKRYKESSKNIKGKK